MHPTCHLPPQVGDGCVIERSLLCNGVKVRALSLCNSLCWQHPRTYLQSFPLVLRQIGAGCVIAAGCVLSFGVCLVRPPCAMLIRAHAAYLHVHTPLTYAMPMLAHATHCAAARHQAKAVAALHHVSADHDPNNLGTD